jgi:hypothetical protein
MFCVLRYAFHVEEEVSFHGLIYLPGRRSLQEQLFDYS